jgi:hypothetical protein
VEIRPAKRNWKKPLIALVCAVGVASCVATGGQAAYGVLDETKIIRTEPVEWLGDSFTPLNIGLDAELQEYTYMLCKAYDVDFHLVMAVMQRESGYRTDVISGSNDYGLMQINKINHKRLSEILGITDFLNPEDNIHAGVYMLSDLFDKYHDTNLVLMAYNMGEGGANKLWNMGIFTSNYAQEIMRIQKGLMEL